MNNVHPLPQPATFEDFWRVCPKKVGKLLALRKWDAVISATGLETKIFDETTEEYFEDVLKVTALELIFAMAEYRKTQIENYANTPFVDIDAGKYKLKDDGKFTLHPATFINKGRFLDYLDAG